MISKIAEVEPTLWNALVGDDDPFVEHAFLAALEHSGSVGKGTGWLPMHVVLYRGALPIGALPLYLKLHSYGEYVFDFGWANAAERAGISYYPKLVAMVPFTPATGRRVLYAQGEDPGRITRVLLDAALDVRASTRASSLHLLFLSREECARVTADPRFLARSSLQFHWHNAGVRSFDEHLASFRSVARKEIRKERRRVAESGLSISVVPGPALDDDEWNALAEFYFDTCAKHGSGPYLTQAFFSIIRRTQAERVVGVIARRDGAIVAGALNFEKGKHLYGRYWGSSEEHQFLHFEVCYHRLIERAIAQGRVRFEAGAQGEHKLRRGLLPAEIHSACHVADPRLALAIGDFLQRETRAVHEEMRALRQHGPSHRDA